ncbi:alkaline phosphatase family protein [Mesorhizobium sp. YC-39]|uniref:alkaline phosphatase family protein n=1 Tax=unclassified Mesorhizobium TaxID=325217 RepID=UPI0021E8739C|nr:MULTISPECIES: alkaline phosphatase family protein [unclassified Mesorhizobium]MCV3207753.1 alkaline phosphatase family protein [Mesorhizobium sp. YC-2]MCV3229480.1 alkaline phosphatase family protein [Mesorhizobium sp. YC-39]
MARKGRRPNILLISCDQWRGDCLSAAGHKVVRTPNADVLAAEGVLFRRHYGGAAPCSPARACLYTGLYQMNNRVCRNGTPLDARHGNIALSLRGLGYDPTLFGYTDVSLDPRTLAPGDPALRSYEGVLPGYTVRQFLPEHQKPWLSWLKLRGVDASAGSPDIHRPAGEAGDTSSAVTNAPPVYSKDETPTAFLTGEFVRWLGEQERDTPWCAHLSFINPHPPFIVPEPYNAMYDPADGPAFRRAENWQAEARRHPYVAYDMSQQQRTKFRPGAKGKVRDWGDDDFRRIRALYYGMISEVDAQLGRIWQAVKATDAWDDTIIVLTSDHAEMMGDHFMLGKGGFFDGSYHIPLIVRDPRRLKAAGTGVDRFTEAVDILPTLLDLLGEEVPPHLDGHSLKPFLDNEAPRDWRDAAHWEFDFRSIAEGEAERHFGIASRQCNLAVIRTENFKYVHFGGGLPPLLFDLERDASELNNLATDPAHLSIRLEFAEKLLAWRAEHLDQSLALAELTEDGVVGYVSKAVGSRQ